MRKPVAKVEKKVTKKVVIDVAENLYTRLDDDSRRKQFEKGALTSHKVDEVIDSMDFSSLANLSLKDKLIKKHLNR